MFKKGLLLVAITSLAACSSVGVNTLEELNENNKAKQAQNPAMAEQYCFDEFDNANKVGSIRTVAKETFYCSAGTGTTWIHHDFDRTYKIKH